MFIDNKYTRLYEVLTSRPDNPEVEYCEKHHIIPRCLGGSNKRSNIIILTARKHFLVHWLLTKMCLDPKHTQKMKYAMRCMSWDKTKGRGLKPWQYQIAKNKLSEASKNRIVSEATRNKLSKSGKKRFEEKSERDKMSLAKLSSPFSKHSNATKLKMSASALRLRENPTYVIAHAEGTKKAQSTPEFRKKRSELAKMRYKERPELLEGLKGAGEAQKNNIVICPHCNKVGMNRPMKRWHFDKCKIKSDVQPEPFL